MCIFNTSRFYKKRYKILYRILFIQHVPKKKNGATRVLRDLSRIFSIFSFFPSFFSLLNQFFSLSLFHVFYLFLLRYLYSTLLLSNINQYLLFYLSSYVSLYSPIFVIISIVHFTISERERLHNKFIDVSESNNESQQVFAIIVCADWSHNVVIAKDREREREL